MPAPKSSMHRQDSNLSTSISTRPDSQSSLHTPEPSPSIPTASMDAVLSSNSNLSTASSSMQESTSLMGQSNQDSSSSNLMRADSGMQKQDFSHRFEQNTVKSDFTGMPRFDFNPAKCTTVSTSQSPSVTAPSTSSISEPNFDFDFNLPESQSSQPSTSQSQSEDKPQATRSQGSDSSDQAFTELASSKGADVPSQKKDSVSSEGFSQEIGKTSMAGSTSGSDSYMAGSYTGGYPHSTMAGSYPSTVSSYGSSGMPGMGMAASMYPPSHSQMSWGGYPSPSSSSSMWDSSGMYPGSSGSSMRGQPDMAGYGSGYGSGMGDTSRGSAFGMPSTTPSIPPQSSMYSSYPTYSHYAGYGGMSSSMYGGYPPPPTGGLPSTGHHPYMGSSSNGLPGMMPTYPPMSGRDPMGAPKPSSDSFLNELYDDRQ